MKINKNINLNINKDDQSVNDYIYCWSEIGTIPSKVTIHGYFKPESFFDYVKEITEVYNYTDVIPSDETPIINRKTLIKLEDEIFLTFLQLDKDHQESIISDVALFYSVNKESRVSEIAQNLNDILITTEENSGEDVEFNLSILNLGQTGFELEYLENSKDFDDIEFYYEEEVLKKVKRVVKSIKKEKKGLTIITGERGCGKTTLNNFIASKVDKNFIFMPCNLIEASLNSSDFRKFLKINRNSVLIIDDAELHFSQMYSKSTFYTNNLLQLIEGIYSDSINLNIILTMNCATAEVDKVLLESNLILDVIEVSKLSLNKIEELCQHLDKKNKSKIPTKLNDILNKNSSFVTTNELGFK